MIDEQCIVISNVSRIKCEDGQRHVVFVNQERHEFLKIRVDNCAIKDGERADWAVERGRITVIVELKGRDVEHAASQIMKTAEIWRAEGRFDRVAGLIIGRQYPKASTSMQRKQQQFAREFRGPLHVVNHNPEVIFENVLSFKGCLRKT